MTKDQPRQGDAIFKAPIAPIGELDIIRTEISLGMVMAGIRAMGECEENIEAGRAVTKSDIVCAIYAAMRVT